MRRRRTFQISPALVTVIVLIVAFGGLWLFGKIDPPRWFSAKGAISHRGMVAIPVSAAPIPAFTKITRDHLWNRATGGYALIYLPPQQVSPELIRDVSLIAGRVMDHDKPATYAFTEADFLPRGTRPGLVAGIPAGKRAMRVPLEKIPGLVGLATGDRFDLVATLAIDPGAASSLAAGGLYGRQLDMQAKLMNLQKQATVRVVVQGGDVVQPVQTRQVPVASSTLTSGLIVRTKPVQEVVIAVEPAEVAHLTEALAVGAEIACVPRSGRPGDQRDSVTPELTPRSPFGDAMQRGSVGASTPTVSSPSGFGAGFTPIETISGGKREIVAAPVKRGR